LLETIMKGWGNLSSGTFFIVLSSLLGGLASSAIGDDGADDGWRRTAQGWERIETWSEHESTSSREFQFNPEGSSNYELHRSDFHPVPFLGFQLVVVFTALLVLSPAANSKGTLSSLGDLPRRSKAA
jgi:hypothetical protein